MLDKNKSKSLKKQATSPSTNSSARLPKVAQIERPSLQYLQTSHKNANLRINMFTNKSYKYANNYSYTCNHRTEQLGNIHKNTTTDIKNKMNDELLHQRKENIANMKFNRRMIILKQITKDNQKLFQRINSQKSLYSQENMNKSMVSIKSASSKANSRCKVKESPRLINKEKTKRCNKSVSSCIPVTICPESVSKIKQPIINQFKSMFVRENLHKKCPSFYLKTQNRSLSMKEEQRIEKEKDSFGMGNMLHKIAEIMFKNRQKTIM